MYFVPLVGLILTLSAWRVTVVVVLVLCAATGRVSREELEVGIPDREDKPLEPSQEKGLRLERVGMRVEPLALLVDWAEVD